MKQSIARALRSLADRFDPPLIHDWSGIETDAWATKLPSGERILDEIVKAAQLRRFGR